jgi:hypothetical protein
LDIPGIWLRSGQRILRLGKPGRDGLRAGSHAIVLERHELARADGGIAENPRDCAVVHHVLEVPDVVLVEIHQREQMNGLSEEMQRRVQKRSSPQRSPRSSIMRRPFGAVITAHWP